MFHAILLRPVIIILRVLVTASLLVAAVMAAEPVPADPVEFKIEEQPMASALTEFARQSDRELLFATDIVDGKEAQTVEGVFEPEEALTQLLADTGLKYSVTANDTILVAEGERGDRDAGNGRTAGVTQKTVMVGQNQTAAPASRRVTEEGEAEDEPKRPLEEIVVTGTHIRGIQNSTSPVTVLDRAYIQTTGYGTTSMLIESLPQNFSLANQSSISTPGVTDPARSQGASINLRGIGQGTTLVLLNGRRLPSSYDGRAVDISALPISAIERVEVLTDGASAIYGSDAVGGVVNFVLTSDYEGENTQLRYGVSRGDVEELRASQSLGKSWASGNLLLSAEYYGRDILRTKERDFVPDGVVNGSLRPEDKNLSLLFHGRQEISERLTVSSDVLYSRRDSYNESDNLALSSSYDNEIPTYSAALAAQLALAGDWQLEMTGSYGRSEIESKRQLPSSTQLYASSSLIESGTVKADGSLFRLAAGPARLAVGAEYRVEKFDYSSSLGFGGRFDQDVFSTFGELHLPVVGPPNQTSGVHALQFSLAARYDRYSNFGSSTDPRFGAMWEPTAGLRFRGSYGTSYLAPALKDYDASLNVADAFYLRNLNGVYEFDFSGTAPANELVYVLDVYGASDSGYDPQESSSYTFGVEFIPESAPEFLASFNFYSIRYKGRVTETPVATVLLNNPGSYGDLVNFSPNLNEVDSLIAYGQMGQGFNAFNPDFSLNNSFDPSMIDIVVDERKRNLSSTTTKGIDGKINYQVPYHNGTFQLGLDGSYIFDLKQKVTAASAAFETVNTFAYPVDLRLRGGVSWRNESLSVNVFANYMDSFVDNRGVVKTEISSYTTVDLSVIYQAERSSPGVLSGVTVALSAQNLLDRDPPVVPVQDPFRDVGFDSTKANPLGRLVAVEIRKDWGR